jgi:hypothetical protein
MQNVSRYPMAESSAAFAVQIFNFIAFRVDSQAAKTRESRRSRKSPTTISVLCDLCVFASLRLMPFGRGCAALGLCVKIPLVAARPRSTARD